MMAEEVEDMCTLDVVEEQEEPEEVVLIYLTAMEVARKSLPEESTYLYIFIQIFFIVYLI